MANGRRLGDGKITVADVTTGLRVIAGLWRRWWPDPLAGR